MPGFVLLVRPRDDGDPTLRVGFTVTKKIGKAVAKDEDSYRYLVESIERFPDMPGFARMIAAAGFGNVKAEPILGGLVAIHSGWKI